MILELEYMVYGWARSPARNALQKQRQTENIGRQASGVPLTGVDVCCCWVLLLLLLFSMNPLTFSGLTTTMGGEAVF